MLPKVRRKAPAIKLSDQDGKVHQLRDYAGKWVVLYFYPKDNTPGCTAEACSFRDNITVFRRNGIVVLGVSPDSVKKHGRFAEKFSLPFPLLSDEDKEIVEKYGVWGEKKFMGRKYMGVFRTTFVIDPTGKIAKVYENVKPVEHAEEVVADIKAMKKVRAK